MELRDVVLLRARLAWPQAPLAELQLARSRLELLRLQAQVEEPELERASLPPVEKAAEPRQDVPADAQVLQALLAARLRVEQQELWASQGQEQQEQQPRASAAPRVLLRAARRVLSTGA